MQEELVSKIDIEKLISKFDKIKKEVDKNEINEGLDQKSKQDTSLALEILKEYVQETKQDLLSKIDKLNVKKKDFNLLNLSYRLPKGYKSINEILEESNDERLGSNQTYIGFILCFIFGSALMAAPYSFSVAYMLYIVMGILSAITLIIGAITWFIIKRDRKRNEDYFKSTGFKPEKLFHVLFEAYRTEDPEINNFIANSLKNFILESSKGEKLLSQNWNERFNKYYIYHAIKEMNKIYPKIKTCLSLQNELKKIEDLEEKIKSLEK